MEKWRLIIDGPAAPTWNMAVDEALLEIFSRNQDQLPTLRFYTWDPPALTLGFFQKQSALPAKLLHRLGIVPIKRISGGAAFLHWGDLTYSAIARAGRELPFDLLVSSHFICRGLMRGLTQLGIAVSCGKEMPPGIRHASCFAYSAPTDICWEDRKIVGSAQYRRGFSILQHGSIMLKNQGHLLDRIFPELKVDGIELSQRVASLETILEHAIAIDELIPVLVQGFEKALHMEFVPSRLNNEEIELASRLVSKYDSLTP